MPDSEPATKVFLLTDNCLLREALPRLVSENSSIRVVGAKQVSTHALQQAAVSRAEVLLLDSSAQNGSVPQFVRQVRQAVPGVRVLVLAMESDEEAFFAVVSAGAVGCLLKDASAADLVNAVRAVARDEAVCPPRLSLGLFRQFAARWSEGGKLDGRLQLGLSRREQQLLPLIGQGLSNKEIASHMNLSEQTVKNHIHRMLRKLGGKNRQDILERCHPGSSSVPYARCS